METPSLISKHIPPEVWQNIISYVDLMSLSNFAISSKAGLQHSLVQLPKREEALRLTVVTGDFSTFCVTQHALYACGQYTGNTLNQFILAPVEGLRGQILQVALGGQHSLVLTDQGLYGCGDNSYGQLGLPNRKHYTFFTKLSVLPGCIQQIAAGDTHSLVLTSEGLYVCGNNSNGELGFEDRQIRYTFTPLPQRVPGQIQKIAVSNSGNLLQINNTWYLTTPANTGAWPELISTYDFLNATESIQQQVIGPNCHFIVTEQGLYTKGDNYRGQLGLGDYEDRVTWTKVENPFGKIQQLVTGKEHTLMLTEQGLYVCGRNKDGQLGLGASRPKELSTFTRIEPPSGTIQQMAAGSDHTLILTEHGLYGCGDNSAGQLGLGNTELDHHSFTRITALPEALKQLFTLRQHFGKLARLGPGLLTPQQKNAQAEKLILFRQQGSTAPPSLEMVLAAASQGEFEQALQLAQCSADAKALWSLGQYYTAEGSDVRKAIQCYQAIPKANPYYQPGNFQLAKLIINLLLAEKTQALLVTVEELKVYKQNFFYYLLQAVDEIMHPLVSLYYQQLCEINPLAPIDEMVEENLTQLMQSMTYVLTLNQQLAELQAKNLAKEETFVVKWGDLPWELWQDCMRYVEDADLNALAVASKSMLQAALPILSKRAVETPFKIALQENTTWCITASALYACGENDYGQLGLGNYQKRLKLKAVKGLPTDAGILQLVIDQTSTFAFVMTTKGLYACGHDQGQLGLGHTNNSPSTFVKVTTLPPGNLQQIIPSDENTFVLTDSGLYVCGAMWRLNFRPLASDVPFNQSNFNPVPGLPPGEIQQFVAGQTQLLMVIEHELYVCGNNDHGQLGLGDTDNRDSFTKVTGLPPGQIRFLLTGIFHSLVVIDDTLYACGDNEQGQLGLGDTDNYDEFTPVQGLPSGRILNILADDTHTLVIMETGVYVSGYNSHGELGLGDKQMRTRFTRVESWPQGQIQQVDMKGCRIQVLTDQGLYGCGNNGYGQLGFSDQKDKLLFTQVTDLPKGQIRQLAMGEDHTAFIIDQALYVCGSGKYGQLGQGDKVYHSSLTQVTALPTPLKQQLGLKQHFKQLTQLGPSFFANQQTVNEKKRKYEALAEESEEACSRNQKQKIVHASFK